MKEILIEIMTVGAGALLIGLAIYCFYVVLSSRSEKKHSVYSASRKSGANPRGKKNRKISRIEIINKRPPAIPTPEAPIKRSHKGIRRAA